MTTQCGEGSSTPAPAHDAPHRHGSALPATRSPPHAPRLLPQPPWAHPGQLQAEVDTPPRTPQLSSRLNDPCTVTLQPHTAHVCVCVC